MTSQVKEIGTRGTINYDTNEKPGGNEIQHESMKFNPKKGPPPKDLDEYEEM